MHYNEYECIPLSSYETGIKAIHSMKRDRQLADRHDMHAPAPQSGSRAIRFGAQLSLIGSLLVGLAAYFIS